MARELARRGLRVTVVASDLSMLTRTYSRRRSPWALRPVREEIRGVPFVWLSAGSYRANDWRRVLSMIVFGVGAAAFLIRAPVSGSTVFIGSSPHLFGAFGTWLAARLRGRPFVFEVRDLWPESYSEVSGSDGGSIVKVLRWMSDFLYLRADAIVVLTEANGRAISERGADASRIRYIPNGVDLAAFGERVGRAAGKRVKFVYAGAHGPANGLDIVLHAARHLQDASAAIDIELVGDGPTKEPLASVAKSLQLANVKFSAPVSKERLPALLSEADAGLMILAPADLFTYGVSPNKLFDYLAADLPVVTNVPGVVSEIVDAAGAGISCAPGDARALADAMLRLADDIRVQPGRYATGRRFVAAHHDRRHLAGELAELLEQLSP